MLRLAALGGVLGLILVDTAVIHRVRRLTRALLLRHNGGLSHMLRKLGLRAASNLIVRHLRLRLANVLLLSWLGGLLLDLLLCGDMLLLLADHLLSDLLHLIDVLKMRAGCTLTFIADQQRQLWLDHALGCGNNGCLLIAHVNGVVHCLLVGDVGVVLAFVAHRLLL